MGSTQRSPGLQSQEEARKGDSITSCLLPHRPGDPCSGHTVRVMTLQERPPALWDPGQEGGYPTAGLVELARVLICSPLAKMGLGGQEAGAGGRPSRSVRRGCCQGSSQGEVPTFSCRVR